MTTSELAARMRSRLDEKFPRQEVREIIAIIFENLKGWNTTDMLIKADQEITPFIVSKADEAVDRILSGEPVQYLFGSAHFYGLTFKVNRDTLIPRQETALLVDIIVKEWNGRRDLKVLDLGTGSGCIAIALARNLPFASVTGIDISDGALAVARENSRALKADVDFIRGDILSLTPPVSPEYDIIVSNPPYIARSEAASMEANVLDYEPHSALFVPDDNPLVFYKAVARFAQDALKPGGKLYFEINPLFADDLKKFMAADGWDNLTLERDMQRHYRFLIASR